MEKSWEDDPWKSNSSVMASLDASENLGDMSLIYIGDDREVRAKMKKGHLHL